MKFSTLAAARQVQHLLLATLLVLIPVLAFSLIENLGIAGYFASPIAGAFTITYSITILAVWNKQKKLSEPSTLPCIVHKGAIFFAFVLSFCWFAAVGAVIGITVAHMQSPDWAASFAAKKVLPALEAASDLVQAILFVVLGFKMIKARKEFLNNSQVCLIRPLSLRPTYSIKV